MTDQKISPPTITPMGAVNWIGLWTLYLREVRRFVKVYTQTLMAPVVTTLLFLAVLITLTSQAFRSGKAFDCDGRRNGFQGNDLTLDSGTRSSGYRRHVRFGQKQHEDRQRDVIDGFEVLIG